MKLRMFWDFYGAEAERTARHFETHLREFLEKNALDLPTGVIQVREGHYATHCDPPDVPASMDADAAEATENEPTTFEQIARALRPRRVESI